MIKLKKCKKTKYGEYGYKITLDDKKIGAIYLDTSDKCLIVSYITISKKNRGKGYSKIAMKKLISMYKGKYKCIITTSIKKTNIPSRKLWKSLGFKEFTKDKSLYAIKEI